MSIDWLHDLERAIDNGKVILGCQTVGRNQWVIGKTIDELRKVAKRAADHRKLPIDIVRVISVHDAIAGDLYLVPTEIGDPGPRGEPEVKWTTVDTKEAAEMMRDVRKGPAPCFAMQIEETLQPAEA